MALTKETRVTKDVPFRDIKVGTKFWYGDSRYEKVADDMVQHVYPGIAASPGKPIIAWSSDIDVAVMDPAGQDAVVKTSAYEKVVVVPDDVFMLWGENVEKWTVCEGGDVAYISCGPYGVFTLSVSLPVHETHSMRVTVECTRGKGSAAPFISMTQDIHALETHVWPVKVDMMIKALASAMTD